MDSSRIYILMVIFASLSVNCIIVRDQESANGASDEQEKEELSPQAEALTYLRVRDKLIPVRQVQRRQIEEMAMLQSRRDTPYRIKRRPRPKPKPKHIRRPSAPKPKYGPPNVNFKPLNHYNPHVANDFYRDTFDKNGQNRLEYQSNGPPISFPSKTYGEPPMIPVLNSNPHTSSQFGSMYSSQLSFKPSLTRPSAQYSIGEPPAVKHHPSKFAEPSPPTNDYNWNKIPLESNFGQDLYKTSVSSYDVPTYESEKIPSRNLFEPASSEPPKLPNHYEQQDFRTPTRTHNSFSEKPNSNTFNFDDYTPNSFQKTTLNDVSESQRIQVKSKSKNPPQKLQTTSQINFDELEKELRAGFPLINDPTDDDLTHVFSPVKRRTTQSPTTTSTTTARPPRYQRRKKRPKFSSTTQHNLDTDDLRDAFGESSDRYEISRSPEETENEQFEPQRDVKYARPGLKKNFVLLSAQNHESEPVTSFEYEEEINDTPPPQTHKIHSTLTRSRIKNNNNANQFNFHSTYSPTKSSSRTKSSDGLEKFEIVSIEKSKSHSYYGGSQPEKEFLEGYGLARRSDNLVNEFNVGMGISFGGSPTVSSANNHNGHLKDTITGVWRDTELLPSNHKFS